MAKKKAKRLKKSSFHIDNDPNTGQRLYGKTIMLSGGLGIYVKGYGNREVPGYAPVAFLVLQDGNLRLHVLPDYNNPEPVMIDLEGAKEP